MEEFQTVNNRKIKVGLVHNVPAPYREGLFKELSSLSEVELIVYYCADAEPGYELKWVIKPTGYKYEILPGITLGRHFHINPTIIDKIIKSAFDVIIVGGYAYATAVLTMMVAKFTRTPLILWSASSLLEENHKGRWLKDRIKFEIKKFLINLSDAYIVPGTMARRYLESLGVCRQKIFIVLNSFDLDFFQKHSRLKPEQKKNIKKILGINEKKIILYVGRLVTDKGIKILLEAFSKITQKYRNVSLLIVGDGPEKAELQKLCTAKKMERVYFAGLRQKEELPNFYGISDIFVLPSKGDAWGYAINEAMACGLPIITTNMVGAAYDVVKHGENGLIIQDCTIDSLHGALETLLKYPEQKLREMGEASQRLIAPYTHKNSANRFLKAIRAVLAYRK